MIKIEKGKLAIDEKLMKPEPSRTGKTLIVYSTRGFKSVQSDDDNEYAISINLTKRR